MCQAVGAAIGVGPNAGLFAGHGLGPGKEVVVDEGTRTALPHVFAAGDGAQSRAGRDRGRSTQGPGVDQTTPSWRSAP